jgi:hypothetical protein
MEYRRTTTLFLPHNCRTGIETRNLVAANFEGLSLLAEGTALSLRSRSVARQRRQRNCGPPQSKGERLPV